MALVPLAESVKSGGGKKKSNLVRIGKIESKGERAASKSLEKVESRENPFTNLMGQIQAAAQPRQGVLGAIGQVPVAQAAQAAMPVAQIASIPLSFVTNPAFEAAQQSQTQGSGIPTGGITSLGADIARDPQQTVEFLKRAGQSQAETLTGTRQVGSGDVLETLGVPQPYAGVAGFIGDIFLDPTSFRKKFIDVGKEAIEDKATKIGRYIKKKSPFKPRRAVVNKDILDENGTVVIKKGTVLFDNARPKPKTTIEQKAENISDVFREQSKEAKKKVTLAKEMSEEKTNSILKNIGKKKEDRIISVDEAMDTFKKNADEEIEAIKANMLRDEKQLDNLLQSQAREDSQKVVDKLTDYMSKNSDFYESKIDELGNTMKKLGTQAKQSEISKMMDDTLRELEELALDDTPVYKSIKKLQSKYIPEKSEALDIITGRVQSSVDDKVVEFNKVLADYRNIRDSIKEAVKNGNLPPDAGKVASNIWVDSFGDLINSKTKGAFGELQSKYKKLLTIQKEAYKLLRPKDYGARKTNQFLLKVSKGGVLKQDLDLMKEIGAEDVVNNVIDIANQKNITSQSYDDAINSIKKSIKENKAYSKMQKDRIKRSFDRIAEEIKDSFVEVKKTSKKAIEQIDENLSKKLKTVKGQKQRAQNLRKIAEKKRNHAFLQDVVRTGKGVVLYEILRRDLRKILGSNE